MPRVRVKLPLFKKVKLLKPFTINLCILNIFIYSKIITILTFILLIISCICSVVAALKITDCEVWFFKHHATTSWFKVHPTLSATPCSCLILTWGSLTMSDAATDCGTGDWRPMGSGTRATPGRAAIFKLWKSWYNIKKNNHWII